MCLPRIEEQEEEEEEEERKEEPEQVSMQPSGPIADRSDNSDSQPGHLDSARDEPDDTSFHLRMSESSDSFSEASESDVVSDYSSDESSVESDHVGRYKHPMRRTPDETGVLPRSANLPPTRAQLLRSSVAGSSSGEEIKHRPQRQRQKPRWMNSNEWILGQMYTFTVDPEEVTYILLYILCGF